MALHWSIDDGTLVLRGELDAAAVQAEGSHIIGACAAVPAGALCLDASELSFCDSHGLRVLLTLVRDRGCAVPVTGMSAQLRRLLEVVSALEHFPPVDAPGLPN